VRNQAKAAAAPSTYRENSSYSFGVALTTLACAIAFLGIGVPAAAAAPEAQPSFGLSGEFAASDTTFSQPRSAIAVDDGYLFVPDETGRKIRLFDISSGELATVLNFTVPETYPRDIAIDEENGDLYVQETDFLGANVKRYESNGGTPPSYTFDPTFSVPRGDALAVDPTTHDLLVTDPGAEGVRRYSSAGVLLATIGTPGFFPNWIAVAADGTFYVAQEGNPTVLHLSGAGAVLSEASDVGSVRGIAVAPATERLVAIGDDQIKLYSPSGTLISAAPIPSGSTLGMAFDPAGGNLFEFDGATVHIYTPTWLPAVEPAAVTDVTAHTALVSAEVDPGAGPPPGSQFHFEYSGDGGTTWKSTPDQPLNAAGKVEESITGLAANSEFQVRVKAFNSYLSQASVAVPFSTLIIAPEVSTEVASGVTETTATLNATINPGGLQTTYYFEYGTTSAYGSRVPLNFEAPAGNGKEDRSFSRGLAGLAPGTTYHYRVVAKSSQGVSEGDDLSFTTVPAGSIPVRAYEQVTPPDKHGVPIDPTFGFQAKADGSAISYITRNGAVGTPQLPRWLSWRGTSDWEGGTDLDPPTKIFNKVTWQTVLAVSPDFTHIFVVSNRKLTPDATEDAANLYVGDVATGEYTRVGTNVGGSSEMPAAYTSFAGIQTTDKYIAGAPDFSWVVFFSEPPLLPGAPTSAMYRWSAAKGLEVVSVLPDGTEATAFPGGVSFSASRFVSADGSRIYFVTGRAQETGDVYLREGDQTKALAVTEITGDPDTPHQGILLGASRDGRYAFFAVYDGKLTDDAAGLPGDLYRYDAVDEDLEYLGAQVESTGGPSYFFQTLLGISDSGDTIYFMSANAGVKVWRDGTVKNVDPSYEIIPPFSNVSPDGRFFAYNYSGGPATGLRLYDAASDELTCVSCLGDGTNTTASLPTGERIVSNRVPQAVNDQGELFFTAEASLVPSDVNGRNDVYAYRNGRLSLVSPGNGPFDAHFADSSADGRDVFFTTGQKLVARDIDGSTDIYDARIGGGLPAQSEVPSPGCTGAGCEPAPVVAPPSFGGSESLVAPGNVKAHRKRCAKGRHARKVHGKLRCVKNKHRKSRAGKKRTGGHR
jgi:hypothetical protein